MQGLERPAKPVLRFPLGAAHDDVTSCARCSHIELPPGVERPVPPLARTVRLLEKARAFVLGVLRRRQLVLLRGSASRLLEEGAATPLGRLAP